MVRESAKQTRIDNYSPTYLYPIQPIGTGTEFVESLLSYVARLAKAHFLSNYDFIARIILELVMLGTDVKRNNSTGLYRVEWNSISKRIDGMSHECQRWVYALETLTGQQNLRFLTTLPWADAIDDKHLIYQDHVWCELCYHDWTAAKQEIYVPLLWRIKAVSICPLHRVPLSNCCPNCLKTMNALNALFEPGFCSNCNSCSGNTSKILVDSQENSSEGERFALQISELIGLVQTSGQLPLRTNIYSIIEEASQAKTNGQIYTLARYLGMRPMSFANRVDRKRRCPLYVLGDLSRGLGLSLSEIVLGNAQHDIHPEPTSKQPLVSIEDKFEPYRIEEILKGAISEIPPPLCCEVAERTGYSGTYLREKFPNIWKEIGARSKSHRNRLPRGSRHHIDKAEKRMLLRDALEEDPPRLPADVAKSCGLKPAQPRYHFPSEFKLLSERYRVWRKSTSYQPLVSRKRLNYEAIQQNLITIIEANESPPPTITQVAKRIGCSRHSLDRFPSEREIIARRFRKYQSDQRAQRQAQRSDELRQFIFSLHLDGIYPSKWQIEKQFGALLKSSDMRLVYQQSMQELGYGLPSS